MDKQYFHLTSRDFWYDTAKIPIEFFYNGSLVQGIPKEWNPKRNTYRIDCNISCTQVVCTTPEQLEIKIERRFYHDFDACEYVAYFTNHNYMATPLIENIRIKGLIPGTDAVLWHGNGDTCNQEAYQWWQSSLEETPLTIEPNNDGTSCDGAFPYMRLQFAYHGTNLAVGWSGTWTSEFSQTENGVLISVGQKRCHMILYSGETMRTPSLILISYQGNEDIGRNVWRKWYFAHILPKQGHKPLTPKCCMHYLNIDGHPEFTGATEQNQIHAIDCYLNAGLHPDIWWMDAGWYPCNFIWQLVGNWYPNPEHFPKGLSPLGQKCIENNIEFLLWFEPERTHSGTKFDKEHPEWLIHWHKNGKDYQSRLNNLGNPECCDYIIDQIDRMIKEYHVNIYRQDCNLYPGRFWREAEYENRIGAIENLHIQGYYRLWDTLLARNPGLLIDSCAGGGRRNDIETMRRSVPFHYTDVGYGNHPMKCKQHQLMHEWIPYFRAHNMNWCNEEGVYDTINRIPDRFSYYVAMAPALTDMTEFNADEEAFTLAREMQTLWRKVAEYMLGTDYYPLTNFCSSAEDFYAAQFHNPETNCGIIHLINHAAAPDTHFSVKLKGLAPERSYLLRSYEHKKELHATGAALLDHFDIFMEKKSGDVWFYEPV